MRNPEQAVVTAYQLGGCLVLYDRPGIGGNVTRFAYWLAAQRNVGIRWGP
jgi:hypothetical protein